MDEGLSEEATIRFRALELRQDAQDGRVERLIDLAEALQKALESNTATTQQIAADFELVKTWVQSWAALGKGAEVLGRFVKPVARFVGWLGGIGAAVATAYFGYKTANPAGKP